jgi:choline transport protein
VAVISWKSWVPLLSWIIGWINTAGWVALTATGGLLGSQLIVGVISFMDQSYNPQRWHQFLIYIGYNLFAFLVNAFMSTLLPIIDKAAFIWSISGFAIICITVLACASPNFESGDFVFRQFINQTGWPDGLAWLLGLLQGGLGLTGFDAVAHMIEEIPEPSVVGPKIMIACVGIGLGTGFVFLTVLLFVLKDVDAVISSAAGPVLQIFYDATNNRAGSICLLMFPLICYDNEQSDDLCLCKRWRPSFFARFRESQHSFGRTSLRVVSQCCSGRYIRLHLSWFEQCIQRHCLGVSCCPWHHVCHTASYQLP